MEEQSSLRKQAKFSSRILCSSQRILRSPVPNKYPAISIWYSTMQINMWQDTAFLCSPLNRMHTLLNFSNSMMTSNDFFQFSIS